MLQQHPTRFKQVRRDGVPEDHQSAFSTFSRRSITLAGRGAEGGVTQASGGPRTCFPTVSDDR